MRRTRNRIFRRQRFSPALDLDFTTGVADPRVSYTRSSQATQIGSTGLLEFAPHNLITNSQFSGSASGSPGTLGTGWNAMGLLSGITRTVVGTGTINGVNYVDVQFVGTATAGASPQFFITAFPAAAAGQRYTYSATVALIAGAWPTSAVKMQITERNSGGTFVTSGSTDIKTLVTGATPVSVSHTRILTDVTTAFVDCAFRLDPATSEVMDFTVRFSAPQLELHGSVRPYIPTTTAAVYGPRFTYDPVTLECRGLLIEESRTNLCVNSRSWDVDGITLAQTQAGADGVANTARLATEALTTAQHRASSNAAAAVSFTFNTTYVLSALVKPGTANRCQLNGPTAAFSDTAYANFSLVGSGAVLASSGTVAQGITRHANGFYLCWMALTCDATASAIPLLVSFIDSDTATRGPSYLGTGLTLIIDHAQCEAGSFPTSIIPTYGTTATRAFEAHTLAGPKGFSADGVTVVAEIDAQTPGATGRSCAVYTGDAVGSPQLMWSQSATGRPYTELRALVSVANFSTAVPIGVSRYAAAFRYARCTAAGAGQFVAGGATARPSVPALMYLGSRPGNDAALGGCLRRLSVIPMPGTDNDVRTLASFAAGPTKLRATKSWHFMDGELPSDVTFSRGTLATRVNSAGLLEYVPHNLMLNSQWAGAGAAPTGWTVTGVPPTITVVSDGPIPGSQGRRIVRTQTSGFQGLQISSAGAFASGVPYRVSIYVRRPTGLTPLDTGGVSFYYPSGGTTTLVVSAATIASQPVDTWVRYSIEVTSTGVPTLRGFIVNDAAIGTGVELACPQVEARVPALRTYFPSTTAADGYAPAFDYDPITLGCLGMRIEETRTNLVVGSRAWSNLTNVTGAFDAVGSDGVANSAVTLTESVTSTQKAFSPDAGTITYTAGSFTATVLAKAGTGTLMQLTFPAAAVTGAYANFDLSAGTVTASANVTAAIVRGPNGFWECSITATVVSVVSAPPFGYMINSPTAARGPTYVGTGLTIVVDHVQCEAGAFPTSIIPTFGAAATRNADGASTTVGSWFNPNEGTFEAESAPLPTPSGGTRRVIELSTAADSANNRMLAGLVSPTLARVLIASGGVASVDSQPVFVSGAAPKFAFTYKANDVRVTTNASAVITDVSAVIPTPLATMYFGTEAGAGSSAFTFANSHIRSVTYFNQALGNEVLQELST